MGIAAWISSSFPGGLMIAPAIFAFGLVAFGFLGMGPVTIAVDSYGPVTDNAQSVFELSTIETLPGISDEVNRDFGFRPQFEKGKQYLEENDGAGNTFKATAKPVLIGTAVVGATTMIFSIIVLLTNGLTVDTEKLSLLHPQFLLGLVTGGAVIYWFTGASMQAVSTGAYRAVEFIKANIQLDSGATKASVEDSKKVVEICTQYAQKGMFNIFLVVFFSTLAFACFEPFFFIGYLISIALFGLYQAIFMANAGGAWDNAKKIVEVELKEKGTPLHAATVVGDTVGDPFKDTSSVAMNPVIKFTTLFGLLAVELAVEMTKAGQQGLTHDPLRGLLRDLDGLRLPLVLRHAHRRGRAGRVAKLDCERAGPTRRPSLRHEQARRPIPRRVRASIAHRANELLDAEIDLRRQIESVAAKRRKLPLGGEVPQDYTFDDAGREKSPPVRALRARQGHADHLQLHVRAADGTALSIVHIDPRRTRRPSAARHAARELRGRREITDRTDHEVRARPRLAQPAAAFVGEQLVQPRLSRGEREGRPDAGAQRVRPARRAHPSLLQHRADVRAVGSRPGRAPRRSDLAAVEPPRRDAGGTRRGLVSEAQVLIM